MNALSGGGEDGFLHLGQRDDQSPVTCLDAERLVDRYAPEISFVAKLNVPQSDAFARSRHTAGRTNQMDITQLHGQCSVEAGDPKLIDVDRPDKCILAHLDFASRFD